MRRITDKLRPAALGLAAASDSEPPRPVKAVRFRADVITTSQEVKAATYTADCSLALCDARAQCSLLLRVHKYDVILLRQFFPFAWAPERYLGYRNTTVSTSTFEQLRSVSGELRHRLFCDILRTFGLTSCFLSLFVCTNTVSVYLGERMNSR